MFKPQKLSFLSASLFAFSLLVSACADSSVEDSLSKEEARAQVGKGDLAIDFCYEFDWYADGVCDDFCLFPDDDCQSDATCYSDQDCGTGELCNAEEICLSNCLPTDQFCAAVCTGFCVEAPEPAPDFCYSDDDCGTGEQCSDDCFSDCPVGMVCPAVCAGVCEPAVPEPEECWGAWTDHNGVCRTPADGVYPDSCCEEEQVQICGGFANLPCQDDEWCSFGTPPSDAAADLSGICQPRPEACIQLFAPVCGSDGETYSNSCFANMAGVDAVHEGACM